MTRYRTIVADPPWHYQSRPVGNPNSKAYEGGRLRTAPMPYPTMTTTEISAIPVGELAERDAHLYLWTTSRYLESSYAVARSWGFEPAIPLVWCKRPKGVQGGAFTIATEFCLFCRRGHLSPKDRYMGNWWTWPRGAHSAKPEAFLDIVEQVSPGPYLEMFSRRARFGWHTWGNESLHGGEATA